MMRRQTSPARQWLIADERMGDQLWNAVRELPRGSGVVVLYLDLPKGRRARLIARLRRLATGRRLAVADECAGAAARVHNMLELRRALHRRTPLVFLSPLKRTQSHPDRPAIPRMRAAALARLGGRRLMALGGMDQREFRRLERLGFYGWAGIGAFRT